MTVVVSETGTISKALSKSQLQNVTVLPAPPPREFGSWNRSGRRYRKARGRRRGACSVARNALPEEARKFFGSHARGRHGARTGLYHGQVDASKNLANSPPF